VPALRVAAVLLMVASGFAALGYQIAWTQQTAIWLGHEVAAVMAVVAAFFGGLAIGALALGPRIDRSEMPGRWYASCEVVIAVWSIVVALLLPSTSAGLLELIGTRPSATWQWSVAFGGTFLMLLPATAAMGATLPALERAMSDCRCAVPGSPRCTRRTPSAPCSASSSPPSGWSRTWDWSARPAFAQP
jgi:spermidine synthase